MSRQADVLGAFHEPVRRWFEASFAAPSSAQAKGWPPIIAGRSTLLLAPTGSGKTLAAFLSAIDRIMFSPEPPKGERCRLVYVSPLKALAADVERNLVAPIAGVAEIATRESVAFHRPAVAVRTGDTPARERARIARTPPDILITTPESLYLVLTSEARALLRSVDAVIVDEIHALVSTKRGAHLALSLERLEALRPQGAKPLQRIGLSATVSPLDEVARMLVGGSGEGELSARPVEIVDASTKKAWDLRVEMSGPGARPTQPTQERDAPSPGASPSITALAARLHELIRDHRSTMIFANSRRLAERLAATINELAGEEIALAHHGSVARERRAEIEDRLKRGALPAMVATSSLELGIDIGAIDLVVQIEAPPSVASGLQRIGRAGHTVGAVSRGVIVPRHRGDLLAAAACAREMRRGEVEATRYPRSPLDVLAQQIVAIVSMDEIGVDTLFSLVRRAAPFAELPRSSFEGVLDMLSGRYPSDEFAELRPRITWDRGRGILRARTGARRVAVINAGTIPDRGLYGVYLEGEEGARRRVGELDEEMVYESRVGDVFLLGASSWKIQSITHDRVLVRPAPGEPGKMPFWHGDRPGRPLELGRAIGKLTRALARESEARAAHRLSNEHGLDESSAEILVRYVHDQKKATGEVPSDEVIVLERYRDELGDLRVCVLSPFGARVHAPWSIAVLARLREERELEMDAIYTDDGIVFRIPESYEDLEVRAFVPQKDELEAWITTSLASSAIFAARFRENAARALLLPRRRPGGRSPLWAMRKRAADLLNVASRYGSFPIILETIRECLRDVFDMRGLGEILERLETGDLRLVSVDARVPSPFSASLLFSYLGNFIYEGDAPLAERRAHALAIDTNELGELLGEPSYRELFDAELVAALERALQRTDGRYPVTSADGLHDLLLSLGDRSEAELAASAHEPERVAEWITELERDARILRVRIAGEPRVVAVEDASRVRDALGVKIPKNLAPSFYEPARDPLRDLLSRYARTHGPFTAAEAASRLGIDEARARGVLDKLVLEGRLREGELRPGGLARDYCDAEVLRTIKRRTLARLRHEIEPVTTDALGRFLLEWHGITKPRPGPDALALAVEQLEGLPLFASALESEILPARVEGYREGEIDLLSATGEVSWVGIEPSGANDGRIALYLSEDRPLLLPPARPVEGALALRLRELFEARGALFFSDLCAHTGAFVADVQKALWELVWAGQVTNDTLAPLRSLFAGSATRQQHRGHRGLSLRGLRVSRRSQHMGPPGTEGRWSLIRRGGDRAPSEPSGPREPSETERRAALTRTLLQRHGVLGREAVLSEGVAGGFSSVYEILRAMEEAGKARRGYFVAGIGATQFAPPGAAERLRALRDPEEPKKTVVLDATDPASPHGALLPWPSVREGAVQRVPGARVILWDGALIGYLNRTEKHLLSFLPAGEPERREATIALATALAGLVEQGKRKTLLIERIDGVDAPASPLGPELVDAGFTLMSKGYFKRR